MNKTQKTQNATKPAWGVVAVIGAMVACTMGDSLILAGIGTALLALGIWLGGYMDETIADAKSALRASQGADNMERRAA